VKGGCVREAEPSRILRASVRRPGSIVHPLTRHISHSSAGGMSGAPPPPGGVVIEHKKGEVNELKASLRNPSLDRDPEKKREVIKRVIAYMTLGIDVSKLFSEMIMVRTNHACSLHAAEGFHLACSARCLAALSGWLRSTVRPDVLVHRGSSSGNVVGGT
jgi:hypothetical protein